MPCLLLSHPYLVILYTLSSITTLLCTMPCQLMHIDIFAKLMCLSTIVILLLIYSVGQPHYIFPCNSLFTTATILHLHRDRCI